MSFAPNSDSRTSSLSTSPGVSTKVDACQNHSPLTTPFSGEAESQRLNDHASGNVALNRASSAGVFSSVSPNDARARNVTQANASKRRRVGSNGSCSTGERYPRHKEYHEPSRSPDDTFNHQHYQIYDPVLARKGAEFETHEDLDDQDLIEAANSTIVDQNNAASSVIALTDQYVVDQTDSVLQPAPKPTKTIVRPPFPAKAKDHSPVIGLSTDTVLRTCFRVGEAINAGCQAARVGQNVIVELYARVTSSWREEETGKQHVVFADLFHDHPPHLYGVYETWKGVELWDFDSSAFLDTENHARLCRCVGQMKREARQWILTILNIWEAAWEDVQWCEGIICA